MQRFVLCLALAVAVFADPARADIPVFACEPEWGALATEIGGARVSVTNATTALQDAHQVQARPGLIAAIRKAQLVFCSGADLEVGWLPLLMRQAANASVQAGQPGNLTAADFLRKLGPAARLDRSQGDVHAEGNPHFVGDPRNLRTLAKVLADRLKSIDPPNAAYYDQQYRSFDARLAAAIAGWERQAAPLRGMAIVEQHDVWAYFNEWLGIRSIASLEPKPGIPATAAHIAQVMTTIRGQPAQAIVVAAYENAAAARSLSERTGLPVVTLAYTVGGTPGARDLFSLYEAQIQALLAARR